MPRKVEVDVIQMVEVHVQREVNDLVGHQALAQDNSILSKDQIINH